MARSSLKERLRTQSGVTTFERARLANALPARVREDHEETATPFDSREAGHRALARSSADLFDARPNHDEL